MIHFDANFLIATVVAGLPEDQRTREWLRWRQELAVSAVAWAEFMCGPVSADEERTARRLLPKAESLNSADAEMAAQLFNSTGRRSRSLADCLIAAVAIREYASLAAINTADFLPFVPFGLTLA